MPELNHQPRRPLDDSKPDGYLESDRDYVLNNLELAVRLLDAYSSKDGMKKFLVGIMTSSSDMLSFAAQVFNDPERFRNEFLN